ncbi:N-acetylmuramoyl-L-alanine amidase family protein [Brumimicrobium aurantiacum]|uniref:N-acetylmuramoyl-L-alanine amidase n=1 Tax=Brumimicrobium aurantiacum TaxID=1737063 RepID=A0A3E1F157_9FLAO|nr:N-acetylmuramoyl-L-alanine amidase [Brumimicrobium aurantiacum]RFC55473.1 N-acetylmuramoyl-L-alanine amidase [Brumimicrobium aurantiacum]
MKYLLKFIGIALLIFTFAFSGVNDRIIVLDIGHGEKDTGAKHDHINEKDVVFNIAKKIKELHKSKHTKIVLTRDSDAFVTLEERAEMINKINPEFVISLHANWHSDKNKKGTEIYISNNNTEIEKSQELAKNISDSFGNKNITIKNANFNILTKVNSPSALIELGFLTNDEERKLLTSEKGQLEFANAILRLLKD